MHAIHHNSIVAQCLSVGQLLNGWLAEFPAILDTLFAGLFNTTSASIGWRGSHEVAGSSDFKTEQSQMVLIEALLSSTYHKM